jgi:tetraacyldisaccharide 4'-kinase
VKAPAFWRTQGALAALLAPLGHATASITARRVAWAGQKLDIPVICVGNAGVGGAGKTIVVRDLLARLSRYRRRPFALSRGYGGRLAGPVMVDPALHNAAEIGDEALLLAADAPTIVARDRAAGGRLAAASGARMIVMDDGLQNPGLIKDVSFLVIDGAYGFGNGKCLPAGPLREPVAAAAARCQAAILIGPDLTRARAALPAHLPVLRADLQPACPIDLRGRRVVGFAGIGRPEKFFSSVRQLGAELLHEAHFPDHHIYSAAEMRRLADQACELDAILVTTEKDIVKFPASWRQGIAVVTVGLLWEDELAMERFLP